MGLWYQLKPRTKRPHRWHIALYLETPSERTDGNWYEALLVRDEDRTWFGILEFCGRQLSARDFRALATKVVLA
jgi:hypothetical protein